MQLSSSWEVVTLGTALTGLAVAASGVSVPGGNGHSAAGIGSDATIEFSAADNLVMPATAFKPSWRSWHSWKSWKSWKSWR